MIISDACSSQIHAPVRTIKARVELLEGSTLLQQFCYRDALISFDVQRVGEGRFFGYGICQRLNVHLRDLNREIDVSTINSLDVSFGAGCDYIYPLPVFYVSEVHRDEKTNELSITAYDALYKASERYVSELPLTAKYTIQEFATACATLLGLPIKFITDNMAPFEQYYETGANFEGTETIRDALDAVAEATQTIYYIDDNWNIVFKKLDMYGEPVATIDKERYFELKSGDNRRLSAICHATELGDNVIATLDVSGTTHYVRDNAFWELREDIDTIVKNALAAVGGLTINQFECSWRGNFLIEIGDKIAFITKDNDITETYLLNDVIEYDGTYSQKTQWQYDDDEAETAENPTNLGDALKQTFAKVDKANKQIDLVASETGNNSKKIAQIQLTTENISSTVSNYQTDTNNAIEDVNNSVRDLYTKLQQTEKDFTITINEVRTTKVDSVETTTGYKFDADGLNVSQSETSVNTTINWDGMRVFDNRKEMLVANKDGVKAEDLHATSYLIIGKNSRFEDYSNRTGCFWIGG